ncbi:GmrSD restriction endonuclease domain-containing protein [Pantoea agglomerans]|uniref:GmrSD restriction endonuclease domain-containing protein n=1 Tax=Enterobacter agglomerans TaxID=549 RepID=UPI00165434CC
MIIRDTTNKIKSVYSEIKDGDLDLRPNFQRGEVWTLNKKRLLIDSILREWYVPPIHTVALGIGKSEVLDGQQRLTAIKDFLDNQFAVDGNIEPKDEEIVALHGKKFKNLPIDVQKRIERFGITIYEITEYNQGEPSELFYRLNQTVKLTSSEARNAIFGDVRDDISSFVNYMEEMKVGKNILGFSNSRMAYNDLLSRVCLLLEKSSIRYQLSDAALTNRYRDDTSFEPEISDAVKSAIDFFGYIVITSSNEEIKTNLTKASSLNWIYLVCCMHIHGNETEVRKLYSAFIYLETARTCIKTNERFPSDVIDFFGFDQSNLRELMMIYIERSSSRVMSIGSIIIRDIIQNISCYMAGIIPSHLTDVDVEKLEYILNELRNDGDVKLLIENMAENWKETGL